VFLSFQIAPAARQSGNIRLGIPIAHSGREFQP